MSRLLSLDEPRHVFRGDLTKSDSVMKVGIDPRAESTVSLCTSAFDA